MLPDEMIDDLDEDTRRKVRFVAEYCAMCDVNAGIGAFDTLPETTQCDYLHDARNAVEACRIYDLNGGMDIEGLHKPYLK